MEMWFSDEHTEDVKLSIRINEQLFSAQSEFQRIDVLDSREFGRILVADGEPDADGEGRVHLPRDDHPRAHGGAPQT